MADVRRRSHKPGDALAAAEHGFGGGDSDDDNAKGPSYAFDAHNGVPPSAAGHVGKASAAPRSFAAAASPPQPPPMEWFAPYAPWVLLGMSAFTRFYRLDEPRGVVFDEVRAREGKRLADAR